MSAITEPDATPSAIEDKPLSKTSLLDLPTQWHSEFRLSLVLLDDISDLLLEGAFATKSQDPELERKLAGEMRTSVDQVRSLQPMDKTKLGAAEQFFDNEKEPWSSLREILPEFASDDVYYNVRHMQQFCANTRFSKLSEERFTWPEREKCAEIIDRRREELRMNVEDPLKNAQDSVQSAEESGSPEQTSVDSPIHCAKKEEHQ